MFKTILLSLAITMTSQGMVSDTTVTTQASLINIRTLDKIFPYAACIGILAAIFKFTCLHQKIKNLITRAVKKHDENQMRMDEILANQEAILRQAQEQNTLLQQQNELLRFQEQEALRRRQERINV